MPIVTGCVRSNGSSCAKTSDTKNRYFGTEHGSEIEMTPGAVNIKGGSKEPLSISFDDSTGVTLKSPKNLNLSADDDIIIKTPASVKAQSQIGVIKAGTENTNVLAGLAVVELVTVAVAAVAVTCGAAAPAPVVGAIVAGVAIAGTAAVASQAASDISRGEVSDMSTYMAVGAREAFIGAVSGAIFGPFGAGEALVGKMVLGGLTNGFESVLRQTLEGKGIDFKTVLFDMGVGAATGGLFHGAGKLVEKASPFVKNAFNKVSSELSENARIAKIALSNMQKGPRSVVLGSNLGNVDEAIGRFAKEFKKAKNGADGPIETRLIPGQRGIVTGGNSTKLGQKLYKDMDIPSTISRSPYQAMHIIPAKFKNHPIIQKVGMDFDNSSNGIFLRNRKSGGVSPMSRHQGNHSSFNDFVGDELNKMDINLSANELEKQVYNLQQKCKSLMEDGLPMYPKEGASADLWKRWYDKK